MSPGIAHSSALAQSCMRPIGVAAHPAALATHSGCIAIEMQQIWSVRQSAALWHVVAPASVVTPASARTSPASLPASLAFEGAGLLLELQASTNASAPGVDHKIGEFFILLEKGPSRPFESASCSGRGSCCCLYIVPGI